MHILITFGHHSYIGVMFLFKKKDDVIVIDKNLVRLDSPPKDTRPTKLNPLSEKKDDK